MTLDELKAYLTSENVSFEEKLIQNGTQLRCENGENFSFYHTGKMVPGGPVTELTETVKAAFTARPRKAGPRPAVRTGTAQPVTSAEAGKDVFIVYGRDNESRDGLELLLMRMGMNPIILSQLPAAGDTLIEKLESYIGEKGNVAYACVLVTPDDEGYITGSPDQKRYRARQNVVMELGMVLARLGRKRVAILIKSTVEQPSDIGGLIYIPYAEKVNEIEKQLYQELETAGLSPRLR